MRNKLDSTNKKIIRQLVDGRRPYSLIASDLNITENTVRTRTNKLLDDGTLTISGLVNPEMVPGLQIVIMGVKLKTMDLEKKAKEFTKLRGVISVAVVTGRYDLIVQLLINEEDDYSMLDFFKKELVKISDVGEVETFVVYQSHNFQVPYIL